METFDPNRRTQSGSGNMKNLDEILKPDGMDTAEAPFNERKRNISKQGYFDSR